MPNPTTNFGWETPHIGGDSNAWGDILNTLFDDIDADLKTVSDVADAALPIAGGTMTGSLKLKTSAAAHVALGSVSGATIVDLTAAQSFSATIAGVTAFSFSGAIAGGFVSGFILKLTNAGAHTVSFPAGVKWPGGSPPAFTASGVDTLVFLTFDNGATWQAFVAGLDIQ